jgi:hypothetical protein
MQTDRRAGRRSFIYFRAVINNATRVAVIDINGCTARRDLRLIWKEFDKNKKERLFEKRYTSLKSKAAK